MTKTLTIKTKKSIVKTDEWVTHIINKDSNTTIIFYTKKKPIFDIEK